MKDERPSKDDHSQYQFPTLPVDICPFKNAAPLVGPLVDPESAKPADPLKDAISIIENLRVGECFCSEGERVRDFNGAHSPTCIDARKFLKRWGNSQTSEIPTPIVGKMYSQQEVDRILVSAGPSTWTPTGKIAWKYAEIGHVGFRDVDGCVWNLCREMRCVSGEQLGEVEWFSIEVLE